MRAETAARIVMTVQDERTGKDLTSRSAGALSRVWRRSAIVTRRLSAFLLLALSVSILAGAPAASESRPQRIISLNLCTDQLLVLLAEPSRIAGVSFLAADPDLSFVADRIGGIRLVSGRAEEILALEPDLILAGPHGAAHTLRILETMDIPVVRIGLSASFDDIRAETARIGAAIGSEARAQDLIATMEQTLQSVQDRIAEISANGPHQPRSALGIQAQGFTAGAGTLLDAIILAAGLRNTAADIGLSSYGYIGLERIVDAEPDFLIGAVGRRDRSADAPDDPTNTPGPEAPSLAHELLRHRALVDLIDRGHARTVRFPPGVTACAAPFTSLAVSALAEIAWGEYERENGAERMVE